LHAAQGSHSEVVSHFSYARQGWIFADTFGEGGLFVYRSSLLKKSAPMYQPVADLIDRYDYQLVKSEWVQDETMMFGEGIASVYDRFV